MTTQPKSTQPTESFIEARGMNVRLLTWGSGPTVVLHHATGFCADIWCDVADLLAERYTVVAMDRRGHGGTDKPDESYGFGTYAADAAAIYQELELEDVPIIGHSAGATEALILATEYPWLARSVVAIEPIIISTVMHQAGGASRMADKARRRKGSFASAAAWLKRYRELGPFKGWSETTLQAYLSGGFDTLPDGSIHLACPPETEARMFEDAVDTDPESALAALDIPVHVLIGESSGPDYRIFLRALREIVPEIEEETVPNCTHFVPMQDAAAVVRAFDKQQAAIDAAADDA